MSTLNRHAEPSQSAHQQSSLAQKQASARPGSSSMRSAGSGLTLRPRLQRNPHSSPSVASQRDESRTRRPPPLFLKEAEPRVSITDDPFFRQYENPQSARLAKLARFHSDQSNAENMLRAADSEPINVNIGVIGVRESGKTTYIKRSMDLADEANHPSRSARNFIIGSDLFAVRMFEYAPHELKTGKDGSIQWPADTTGRRGKHINGSVVLCDVTNERSWEPVTSLLEKLQRSSVPALVVFNKCEEPLTARKLDPMELHTSLRDLNKDVSSVSVSGDAPDSPRRSVNVLLRKFSSRSCSPRPRSNTGKLAQRQKSPTPSHVRATSDISLSSNKSAFPMADVSFLAYSLQSRAPEDVRSPKDPKDVSIPERSHPDVDQDSEQQSDWKPIIRRETQFVDRHKLSDTLHSPRSFYLDDSPRRGSAVSAMSEESDSGITLAHSVEVPPEQLDYTFEQLVDLVVARPSSTADIKFRKTFLALYPMFASASRLLGSLIQGYTDWNKKQKSSRGSKGEARHLEFIQQWISTYPGDLASPTVYDCLKNFLIAPIHGKACMGAIQQIMMSLKLVSEDDDTSWGSDEVQVEKSSGSLTFYSRDSIDESSDLKFLNSDPTSPDSSFGSAFGTTRKRTTSKSQANADLETSLIFRSGSTVALTAMGPTAINDKQVLSQHVSSTASRQAALLVPTRTYPFTKIQWRAFIAQPDELIANELTRIDWIMFSSVRTRDLVRHVTIPKEDQSTYRSLVNVERAVDHFNHLAFWVANLVLFRDKPKHRAQALEKVMRIARHLRYLNNYNTLGAIIAGIHGAAIHRLAATKELIPVDVQRDFMKLEILMGTSKGSAAYRLAWENTKSERIPFLPMVRKDLATMLAANKTFSEDEKHLGTDDPQSKINWNKFQIMGDILLSIQAAQAEPYPGFATNDEVKALILDCKIMKDDDKLYERSMYLEPTTQNGTPTSVDVIGLGKRRLTNWLNRTA